MIMSTATEIQLEMIGQHLPCAPERLPQARTQILELCIRCDVDQPYDLLICADKTMKSNNVSDDDRIASIVCDRVLLVRAVPDSHKSLLNR